MALKIVISPRVKFKVAGKFADEAGNDQPFDFTLTAKRLNADEVGEKSGSIPLREFVREVAEDWSGVNDETGAAIPFSADALDSLLRLPGVALLAFRAYVDHNGAREKN